MKLKISVILVFLSMSVIATSARADLPYQIEFLHTWDTNDRKGLTVIEGVTYALQGLLEVWSWGQRELKGTWRVRFAHSEDMRNLDAHAESAFGLSETNQLTIVLVWDRIRDKTEFPTILAFEHLVARMYQLQAMGGLDPKNPNLADPLRAEIVQAALYDVLHSTLSPKLSKDVHAFTENRWRSQVTAANASLTPSELKQLIEHLSCSLPLTNLSH